ncbi:hypothetical protein ACIGCZ_29020 [Streptomyces nigra]|uniref:hypothetical protein n=1 Tax=Streptomyces nigra TaxID=1827580 RepID=UPI0037D2A921
MTTTADAPTADETGAVTLEDQLIASATGRRRAAAQALVEEETILALDAVRRLLVVEGEDGPVCQWERLMGGQLYRLGLDEAQRAFLGLVMGMVGIGLHTLSVVEELDERRLLILMRAMPLLAANDRIAVGTRV